MQLTPQKHEEGTWTLEKETESLKSELQKLCKVILGSTVHLKPWGSNLKLEERLQQIPGITQDMNSIIFTKSLVTHSMNKILMKISTLSFKEKQLTLSSCLGICLGIYKYLPNYVICRIIVWLNLTVNK